MDYIFCGICDKCKKLFEYKAVYKVIDGKWGHGLNVHGLCKECDDERH